MQKRHVRWHVWILLALLALLPASASAQLTSLGATVSGPARDGTNSAVAYDDKHDVFLHVWEDNGATVGRFLHFDGTPAGASFTIAASASFDWPVRVAYTHGTADDVFAVLYTTMADAPASLQFVKYTGTGPTAGQLIGIALVVAQGNGGGDITFNPLVRRFVVAYAPPLLSGLGADNIGLREFSPDGVVVGDRGALSDSCTGCEFDQKPMRLAVDWQGNHCLLTDAVRINQFPYTFQSKIVETIDPQISGTGVSSTLASCVPPAPVTVPSATLFSAASLTGPFIPSVQDAAAIFLPEASAFLTAWTKPLGPYDMTDLTDTYATVFDGTTPARSFSVITNTGYDDRSSLAYDAESRRVLLVAEGRTSGPSSQLLNAVVLDGQGNVVSGPSPLPSQQTSTAWHRPGVIATRGGQFVVSYIADAGAVLERFSLPLASTPGPRWSHVQVTPESPTNASQVGSAFDVTGWTLDFGAASGTGIDAVHVWAFPTDGSAAVFLGEDKAFDDRSDVAASYGSHFLASGYRVHATGLSPGRYTLAVYGHSTIAGMFTGVAAAVVTVTPPVSQPVMAFNPPTDGAVLTGPFLLGGWAIDRGAPSGPGVNAVHVWAFPTNGSPAIFVGAAEYFRARVDVAGIYGSQFLNSGYLLENVSLPLGDYTLVAYALSALTGTFNDSASVHITVQAPVPNPAMAVDAPSSNTTLPAGQPFTINGWAVDRGAPIGTGVSAIHVWAFPTSGAAPTFLGVASSGAARPDLVSYFGVQFTNAGYTLAGSLPAGAYDLYVFAYSTVSNSFNQARVVRVSIVPPP